jgi:hypothetical protein
MVKISGATPVKDIELMRTSKTITLTLNSFNFNKAQANLDEGKVNNAIDNWKTLSK